MPRRRHQAKLSGLVQSAADKKKKAAEKRIKRCYKKGRTETAELLPQHVMDARPSSAAALLTMLHLCPGDKLVVLGCGRALEYVAGARELGVKRLSVAMIDVESEAVELAKQLLLGEGARACDDGSYLLPPPPSVPHLRGCEVRFTLWAADLNQITMLPQGATHVFTSALADVRMTRHVLHLAARSRPGRAIKLAMFLPRFRDVFLLHTVTASCTIQYTGSANASCRMVGMATVAQSGSAVVGQRVMARYQGGPRLYGGTVGEINANGTLRVDFDDGDVDCDIKAHEWRV